MDNLGRKIAIASAVAGCGAAIAVGSILAFLRFSRFECDHIFVSLLMCFIYMCYLHDMDYMFDHFPPVYGFFAQLYCLCVAVVIVFATVCVVRNRICITGHNTTHERKNVVFFVRKYIT